MNKYKVFYKGREETIEANTTYEAQIKYADKYKVKKSYEITVILLEKQGKEVIHEPLF